jgi:hypothetical protein
MIVEMQANSRFLAGLAARLGMTILRMRIQ